MTPRQKKGDEPDSSAPSQVDGKEGLGEGSEDAAEGTIEPSAELEEALREASEAVGQSQEDAAAAQEDGNSEENELERVSAALAETEDRFLRLQAEFENFRKRSARERAESHRYGHQNFVKDLLPAVDNLERAVDHATGGDEGGLEGVVEGVELVCRELLSALAKHGVSEIEALGEVFDPNVHEAVGQVEHDDHPPNTVVHVLEKGYRIHDRMIRPARVMVSTARTETGENED